MLSILDKKFLFKFLLHNFYNLEYEINMLYSIKESYVIKSVIKYLKTRISFISFYCLLMSEQKITEVLRVEKKSS